MATNFIYGTALGETLVSDTSTKVNDNVYGYAGNDIIKAGTGTNLYDGGMGIDTVDYSATSLLAGPSLSVNANLTAGTANANYQDGSTSIDTLVGIENLTGTKGNDQLTGDGNNNKLSGGNGTDYLYGMDGEDNLLGGNGDDHMWGGAGDDALNGGNGSDTYYWGTGDGVDTFKDTGTGPTDFDEIISSAAIFTGLTAAFNGTNGIEKISGATVIDGSAAKVTWNFTDVDLSGAAIQVGNFANNVVTGSTAVDVMFGNALKDTFNGGDGGDVLFGYAGNDVLNGNDDSDFLYGGLGIDAMNGGDGNDFLDGGAGKDTYTGGAGNDIFYIKLGDSSSSMAQADIITQFQGVATPVGDNDFVQFDTTGPSFIFKASEISPDHAIVGFGDASGTNFIEITVTGGTVDQWLASATDWAFV